MWVVESGAYEQRGINLIAATRDAALAAVKATYGEPYRVQWRAADDGLIGDFENVPGYACAHTAHFSVTEYQVCR